MRLFFQPQSLMTRVTATSGVLALLLSTPILQANAWADGMAIKPDITVTTLPSGQQVYVDEIHTQPIVTIDTWVNTGSAEETPDNNGVSHFLEHLLFKGTPTYPVGASDRILESRGATFNAATSNDFTHFHITTATPYFKEALALHADMLLNATINAPELDRERKVVQEEINRSLDNPQRKVYIALSEALFGDHPYAMDTLGPKSNIQTIPRDKILGYYHRWYQPQNFKTVVVGDVNAADVTQAVNEAFTKATLAQQRPAPGIPKTYPVKPLTTPKSVVFTDPDLSNEQMALGFLAPPVTNHEDNDALDVAALILGQGASSRLYQNLKEKQQLVTGISDANSTQKQAGIFYIDVELKPEKREAAKEALLAELNTFKSQPPSASEVEKAKTQVVKDFAFLTESTQGVANTIGEDVTIDKLSDYTDYVSNIQKITPKDVQQAAIQYLDPNKAVLVEALPASFAKDIRVSDQQNVALLKQAANTVPSAEFNPYTAENNSDEAQVQKVTLKNGTTLLLKPSPLTQTVALDIFAKGGIRTETKPGVCTLTASVLMKGSESRPEEVLDRQLEEQGLSLSANGTDDYLQVSGESLSTNFSQLLMILSDVLAHPAFAPSEITKERTDLLTEIQTNRDEPSNLMFEKLSLGLYPQHPYGLVGSRLEAALPKLTRQDLINYYHHAMQPKDMVISIVGNFNPDFVKSSLESMLSELPKDTAIGSGHYPVKPQLKKNVIIDTHKPAQAATWIGYGWLAPGISTTNRDYFALKLINTLLGSGLSSRLFVDLREKQGLAYHVSSLFPSSYDTGHFIIYIGTDPKNQPRVLSGFDDEIKRIETVPVTDDELATVKSKLIGQFALAHESNANQAMYLGLYETLGVGYQFDTQYPQLIQSVSMEDIQHAAMKTFGQPKVVSIVDPKQIRTDDSTIPQHQHR